jgi:hypothetical protein
MADNPATPNIDFFGTFGLHIENKRRYKEAGRVWHHVFASKSLPAFPKELMLCEMEVAPRENSLLVGPSPTGQTSMAEVPMDRRKVHLKV